MIRKRGDIYHAIIYHKGKRIWKSLETGDLTQAGINYGNELKRIKLGENPEDFVSIPWKEFKNRYLEQYCSVEKEPGTILADKSRLRSFEHSTNIRSTDMFTPATLKIHQRKRREQGRPSSTINREIGLLKNMAWWGQTERYIAKKLDFSIIEKLVENKKKRVFYEKDEADAIRQAIESKQTFSSEFLRNFLKISMSIAGHTGMRPGEILQLRWSSIDYDSDIIPVKIVEGWAPKDKEERDIPFFDKLKADLRAWQGFLKKRGLYDPNGYVMLKENGKRPGKHYIGRLFGKHLKRAKINKGRFYVWRHTFGTHMVDKTDLRTLQQILGHASVQTTENYTHLRSEELKRISKLKLPF